MEYYTSNWVSININKFIIPEDCVILKKFYNSFNNGDTLWYLENNINIIKNDNLYNGA
jgi:hypothetical protein